MSQKCLQPQGAARWLTVGVIHAQLAHLIQRLMCKTCKTLILERACLMLSAISLAHAPARRCQFDAPHAAKIVRTAASGALLTISGRPVRLLFH